MADPIKPTRSEEVRQERRRKPGSLAAAGYKLGVDESKLDRTNYHYRWANDKDGRVQQLYGQDYDPAPEIGAKPDNNGLGTVNTAQAGVVDGKPFQAIFLRKPIKMHNQDQAEKEKPLDKIDEAIRRGSVSEQKTELKGPGVYTPGVNIIESA